MMGGLFWSSDCHKKEKSDFLNKLVVECGGKWPFRGDGFDLPTGIITVHGQNYIRITRQEFDDHKAELEVKKKKESHDCTNLLAVVSNAVYENQGKENTIGVIVDAILAAGYRKCDNNTPPTKE
jgi:hypothetical protein